MRIFTLVIILLTLSGCATGGAMLQGFADGYNAHRAQTTYCTTYDYGYAKHTTCD